MTPSSNIEPIKSIGRLLGVPIEPFAAEKLADFAEELCRWGRRINLTGAAAASGFIEGPLFDSLTVMPLLLPADTLVDVGSGGGLPGVPVAIMNPQMKVTLVEPRGRRAAFLRHIVHRLGLDAEVVETRFESLSRKWSAAVSQAVWEPEEWAMKARSIVTPGGQVYILSSRDLGHIDPTSIQARYRCEHPTRGVSRYSFRVAV